MNVGSEIEWQLGPFFPKKAFTDDHASPNTSHFCLLWRLNLNPSLHCFSLISGLSFALLSLDLPCPGRLALTPCAQQGIHSVSRAGTSNIIKPLQVHFLIHAFLDITMCYSLILPKEQVKYICNKNCGIIASLRTWQWHTSLPLSSTIHRRWPCFSQTGLYTVP